MGEPNSPLGPPWILPYPSVWLKGLRPLENPHWAGLRTAIAEQPSPEKDSQGKGFPLSRFKGDMGSPEGI